MHLKSDVQLEATSEAEAVPELGTTKAQRRALNHVLGYSIAKHCFEV